MIKLLALALLSNLLSLSAAPDRIAATTLNVPDSPPAGGLTLEPAFPGLSFNQPLCIRSTPGNSSRLFIAEKTGDLEVIPDVTSTNPSKVRFLDVDGIINSRPNETFQSSGEQGLLSVAFHPNYPANGYFFTVYVLNVNGTRYQRLSRWHDPNPNDNTADPNSEEVLIEMRNQAANHNGGDIHFGPDGYLYMSWGDEGLGNDDLNNGQFLDKDFWNGLMRIDVDLEPQDYTASDGTGNDDANIAPNSHPAIVLHNGNPLYEVPADNPWVGATSFNNQTVNPNNTRTEFFAIGFRNPWRFSFDSLTGELWLGDVGQGAFEEVSLVKTGENHGWAFWEGDALGAHANETINGATRFDVTHTRPVWDYARGSGSFQGRSVTGGVVYRGTRIQSLIGKYIFADYAVGNIWSLERTSTPGSPNVERLLGEPRIAAFGTDPTNQDVLLADLEDGIIHRLVVTPPNPGTFPETLAETGIFSDLSTLTPNPGVVAYDINLPFWSDHALKQRWFAIPNTTDQFTYQPNNTWDSPVGTVWVKHFDLETTRGNPATKKRIETRLLVRTASGSYGVSYKWNDAGTNATLVSEAGEDLSLNIQTQSGTITQSWRIPSYAECATCHTSQANHSLSFNTPQLNRTGTIGGETGNFLTLLQEAGYINPGSLSNPDLLPAHPALDDDTYSLEARVRAYLDVNCAYCHQDQGSAPASWDGNSHLSLSQTMIINELPSGTILNPADRLIVPGQPNRSVILNRVASTNGYTRMPALGTNIIDQQAVQLLTDWIGQEATSSLTYEDWRLANFGNLTSPEGNPTANPDNDSQNNLSEWLALTNPNDPSSTFHPSLVSAGPSPSLQLPAIPGRRILIEHSLNLENNTWAPWPMPGNNGTPRNPNLMHQFTLPTPETQEFFRLRIEPN